MYDDFETTLELGAPVELYDFAVGATTYRFTNVAQEIVYSSQTYTPAALTSGNVSQTNEVSRNNITIAFPRTNEFAGQFIGFPSEDIVLVTLRRGHFGDPDEEYIIDWDGRVAGAKASGNSITLECESVFTSVRRSALHARYNTNCRHVLYQVGGNKCNINKDLFKHTGQVITATGTAIQVFGADGEADGYYTGGMLIASSGASRFIVGHTGDVVTLTRPLLEVVPLVDVDIFPGCDRLRSTCINKFNNLPNFGGQPYIPPKNPFGGTSLI